MAHFKEHCKDCKKELGNPFVVVHLWLDKLFKIYGPLHRPIRHNSLGVEKVRQMWGDEAAKAAEIHIKKDEGCVPVVDNHFMLLLADNTDVYVGFLQEYKLDNTQNFITFSEGLKK